MVSGSPVFKLSDDVVLLDVREDDEWTAGHAPQAVHVPMGQVPQRLDEIAAAFPDPPVYVVCRSGMRSAQITAYLAGIGLDAVNVDGGMQSWLADGRPLVAETSAPPQVL
ncbi:MAG TPA: rhodanese-like domain-containing protein [Pseudonocardiaceae bacterium]|jgi:rhodanese-related sulfurtransferase